MAIFFHPFKNNFKIFIIVFTLVYFKLSFTYYKLCKQFILKGSLQNDNSFPARLMTADKIDKLLNIEYVFKYQAIQFAYALILCYSCI